MGVQVTFNYAAWVARYPEFNSVDPNLVNAIVAEAQIHHRNDGGGPIIDPVAQLVYLNMVVAHLVSMNAPQANGQPAPPLVGRISNAAEGSVNVAVENAYPPGTPQWWQQTKYGSAYYAATLPYRTMRYVRGHPRRQDAFWPR